MALLSRKIINQLQNKLATSGMVQGKIFDKMAEDHLKMRELLEVSVDLLGLSVESWEKLCVKYGIEFDSKDTEKFIKEVRIELETPR